MDLYTDPRLSALGILHGTTHRRLGNMRLTPHTQALFTAQHIPESAIARFKQIHSDKLISVFSAEQASTLSTPPLTEADGWVVQGQAVGAAILTADCTPLIVWDEQTRIVGLSHCGWRAVAAQLPKKTVQSLYQAGAKGPLSAWVGPHIQACCFEVQTDVAEVFPGFVEKRNEKLFVNLSQAILHQLTQEGLTSKNIVFDPHCTCCEPENFFSFRRDHTKDAMLTFVYIP